MFTIELAFWIAVWLIVIVIGVPLVFGLICLMFSDMFSGGGGGRFVGPPLTEEQLVRRNVAARREDIQVAIIAIVSFGIIGAGIYFGYLR